MPKKSPKTHPVVTAPAATGENDARVWLRANGYDDIAERIDSVMAAWKTEGKATRRNWWEILAGSLDGTPRIAGGLTFPVLRAARIRQGLDPDVPNSVQRSPDETAPPVRVSPRWPKKRRRTKKR